MYSDVFCRVYNELGWNSYPEAFGEQLLSWLAARGIRPETSLDLACGTGILCRILHSRGIRARGMDLSAGMIAIARAGEEAIRYDVADMVSYCPQERFDLVTCTGDAFNHILDGRDLRKILENIHTYLAPGGWLVFDILNEREVSASDPFEMELDGHTRVWFQMTRPARDRVELRIRVWEDGALQLEETITETIHDPAEVCGMLRSIGFRHVTWADRLLPEHNGSATWYITAQKDKGGS